MANKMNDNGVYADEIFKINALFRKFEHEHQEEEIARQERMLDNYNHNEDDEVKIINYKQACMYVKNGLQPIRLEYTDKMVYVFDKIKSYPLYEKWCNYELK